MGSTIALAEAARLETSYLPAGWEIKVVAGADELDGPAPAARLIDANEQTGEVTAIVGVTGIVDHVNDLIEPGAYSDTLTKRRPKVCWAHSWEAPIGKVLRIEEWLPGDPRFGKVGAQLDGKAWPAEAGALVAHMQLNLKSDKGREAFAAVQFYSETGECEWSIGWQPIPAKTLKRKDGVRVCKSVELYEVSPVLFGAAPLTRTLEVKALNLAAATPRGVAPRVGQAAGTPDQYPDADVPLSEPDDAQAAPADEATLHRNAMDEIDWDEVDAAGAQAPASPGTPAAAAHPAAPADDDELAGAPTEEADDGADDSTDDDEADEDPAEEADETPDEEAAEDDEEPDAPDGKNPTAPPFAKKKKNGQVAISAKQLASFTDVLDLAGLGVMLPEVKAEGGADQNKGGAEQLRRWYVKGEGASRIAWGTPGDYNRCVGIATPHMGERAHGYCQLRHKDALGIYTATHAAQERSAVAGKAFAAAATLAKSWNPLLEVGVHAAHDQVQRKFISDSLEGLTGSFEQRQAVLRQELDEVLRDAVGWKKPELPTGDRSDRPEPAPGDDCYVSIDGTWPDRVVATIVRYGPDRDKQTFMVPYTFSGDDEVEFGKPQLVELQVSIVPAEADDAEDADELEAMFAAADEADDAEEGADDKLTDALMLPAISLLGTGIGALKSALVRSPETKAGRVLSEANASRLRGALEHLLEVARSAGIDLPGWTGTDQHNADPDTLPDTTAPSGAAVPPPSRPGLPTSVKTLTPADIAAQLAALTP